MKVLMFGWEYPPHISGGLGTACFGLTKGLTSFNHIDLTFVLPQVFGDEDKQGMSLIGASDIVLSKDILRAYRRSGSQKSIEFKEFISAYTSPEQFAEIFAEKNEKRKKTTKRLNEGKLELTGKYGLSLFDEISKYSVVASQISRNTPHDIIHAHDWLTYPAGIEAKKVSGKPLVVHVHATEYDRSGNTHNKKVFEIEQRGMALADKVITVSNYTRQIIINEYKINPEKVTTIHNGVEPIIDSGSSMPWKKKINEKVVTYFGRITRQKGPEYFVKAAYKVLQKMENVRFVMAGSGDLLEKMILYTSKLNINDRFHFTGFLQGEEVHEMYSMSDLYVMPSVSEPFGISPLEAMQRSVPVIISNQSGVSEVISNAIKIDYWDIDAMADAIYGVLKYDPLAKHLQKYSKLEVDNISWTNAAAKMTEMYDQILN